MPTDVEQALTISSDLPADALASAEAQLAAAERSGDSKARAIALIALADANSRSGKATEAVSQAQEAADLCEDIRFDAGQGAALATTARICAKHGGTDDDLELGLDAAEDAQRLFQKLGNKKGQAIALWSQAQAEGAANQARRAVALATEALVVLKDLREHALETMVCETLADSCIKTGDFPRATQAMIKAQGLAQSQRNKMKEAECIHKLAQIEIEAGNEVKAMAALDKARFAFRATSDHKKEAEVMATERDMHQSAGNFIKAIEVAKEAVTLFHDAGDRVGEGKALLKVSEMLLENNDIAKAQKLVEIAIGMLRETQDSAAITQGWELAGALKHAQVKRDMHEVIERNQDFMHVPKSLIVDPGFSKRLQYDYFEAAKQNAF